MNKVIKRDTLEVELLFETVNQQFKAIQELERRHFRWLSLPPINVDTNVCLVAANVGSLRNCDLPGQKCRGLIEAIPVDKNEAARGIIFPGRNAGVSLKLHSLM